MTDLPPQVQAVVESALKVVAGVSLADSDSFSCPVYYEIDTEIVDALEAALRELNDAPPPEPLPLAVRVLEREAAWVSCDGRVEDETARQCREAIRRLTPDR